MELFDEENIHTDYADQWENYGTLNDIEDERSESLADSEVERNELLHQIFIMIRNTLSRQESEILCHALENQEQETRKDLHSKRRHI